MPLGAARIALFSIPQVVAEAEVIRAKVSVSAEGNAQISTTESQFGGASAEFDGSGDYLLLNNENTFRASNSGDLTLECWFYSTSFSKIQPLFSKRQSNGGGGEWELQIQTDGTALGIVFGTGSGGNILLYSTTTFSLNTWYHIAMVRNGSAWSLYVNGTSEASDTETQTPTVSSMRPLIGTIYGFTTSRVMTGNIDEFRISNTARYTTNFTPQTEPHVNDENTLLLLHMDGTDGSQFFEDDNGVRAPVGVAAQGNAQISTAESQFGGASAEFDATTDTKLEIYKNLSENGEFTLEFWFLLSSFNQGDLYYTQPETSGRQVVFVDSNANLVIDTFASGTPDATGSNPLYTGLVTNSWFHYAYVRESDLSVKIYINGTQQFNGSSNVDWPTGGIWFGSRGYDGYIDEVRFSNTARYTANFTPQTEPHVNDDNTLLLLHMDGTDGNTDFLDDNGVRQKVGVKAENGTQISTAQSQFGGASALFDGTDDRLVVQPTGIYQNRADNFTYEGWIRLDTLPATDSFKMFLSGTQNEYMSIKNRAGTYVSDIVLRTAGGLTHETDYQLPSLVANTWYHWAIVKQGSTLTHYWDGTALSTLVGSSGTMTSDHSLGTLAYIGMYNNVSLFWDGYIDELRISNTARYTANFAPPTEPFQNDDNTLLLLHMDGTDGSTTFIDDNGVTPNHDYGA